MRNLPRNKSPKQELIIKAVEDFCGDDGSSKRNKVNATLWIMGRKRGIELTGEEKEIVWYVQQNLADDIYPMDLELKGISIS